MLLGSNVFDSHENIHVFTLINRFRRPMQVMNVLYIEMSAAETDFLITLISGRFVRISYKISCGQLINLHYFSSPGDLVGFLHLQSCYFYFICSLHCFYCINCVVRTVT